MKASDTHLERPAPTSRMSGRVREVSLPLLTPPESGEFTEHRTSDGTRIFVARSVIEELERLERAHHPNEAAGLLFGRYFTNGWHACTLVTNFIPPEPGEIRGTRSSVTITSFGAQRMRARARRIIPCADCVGWGHTHPTFEPFFSGTDRAEQRLWTQPASVGIVLSGLRDVRDPYHVYVGPESAMAVPMPETALPSSTTSPPLMRQQPEAAPPNRRAALPIPPRRRTGALAYRLGVAAALVAAVVLAGGSWWTATRAQRAADEATARSASAAGTAASAAEETRAGTTMAEQALRTSTLAIQRTRAGERSAQQAVRDARAASKTGAKARKTMEEQILQFGRRISNAENVAANAAARAARAEQDASLARGAVTSLKSEVAAARQKAAEEAGDSDSNRTKPTATARGTGRADSGDRR